MERLSRSKQFARISSFERGRSIAPGERVNNENSKQIGHGFRHLISTALNERGYNRDWIERQIAYGDDNEIRAVYNEAEYLDQRQQMIQEWAGSLDALRVGRDVVPIRQRGRAA